jgi:hypothetical protein
MDPTAGPDRPLPCPDSHSDQEHGVDSLSIDLKGSEVESIVLEPPSLRIRFSRAYLIKTMTGSAERTRWWQSGELVIEDPVLESPIPDGPLVCRGGDIEENIYTYRDMIPIPLASRGHARCALTFEGDADPLVVQGRAVRLEMIDTPKYIEHLR